jgi:hypothetical protein
MVNEAWISSFGSTAVDFLESGVSDHSPASITVSKPVSYGPKPFKFFNFWAEHEIFLLWVAQGWSLEVQGVPMFRFTRSLKL